MFKINRKTSYKETVKNFKELFDFILNNDLNVKNYDHPHYIWGLKQKVFAKNNDYKLIIFEDSPSVDAINMYSQNKNILYSRMLSDLTKKELERLGKITEKFKVNSETPSQKIAFIFIHKDIMRKIDSFN